MSKIRVKVYALGGTIATVRGEGGMRPGLGAEDLLRAVPELAGVADMDAETVSRIGSPSLALDDLYRFAAKIQEEADQRHIGAAVVTQGTDTLEETAFLLDCLLDVTVPVVVIGAMRNPSMASHDGPGNLLAATRLVVDDRVRRYGHRLGVMVAMLDGVHAAVEVAKSNGYRIDAFESREAGPLGSFVEDRVVLTSVPVREWKARLADELGRAPAGRLAKTGRPIALQTVGIGESGGFLKAMLAAPDRLGYAGLVLGLMGGGHVPQPLADLVGELAQRMPVVGASRTGAGALLRATYDMEGGEIDLQRRGVVWGGRLSPLKARIVLDLLLRAGADRTTVDDVFRSFE